MWLVDKIVDNDTGFSLYSLRMLSYTDDNDYRDNGRPKNFRENVTITVKCLETKEKRVFSHIKDMLYLRDDGGLSIVYDSIIEGTDKIDYKAFVVTRDEYLISTIMDYRGYVRPRNMMILPADYNMKLLNIGSISTNGVVVYTNEVINSYSTRFDTDRIHTIMSYILFNAGSINIYDENEIHLAFSGLSGYYRYIIKDINTFYPILAKYKLMMSEKRS